MLVVVAGAGQVGRQNFEVLKGRLLHDGIALLEYDKRGGWRSTGKHDDDLSVQVHDAAILVDFLRARHDIDGSRIAILGICYGAVVASALVARDPEISGLVLLSGLTGGPTQFLETLNESLASAGLDSGAVERLSSRTADLLDARSRGAPAAESALLRVELVRSFAAVWNDRDRAEEVVAWLDTAKTLSAWNQGMDRLLPQIRVPVLAVYASIDDITPAAVHVPVVEAALARNADATVVELPGVNHIFQHHLGDTGEELEEPRMPNSAPEMVQLVGDWLHRRLTGQPAAQSSASSYTAADAEEGAGSEPALL